MDIKKVFDLWVEITGVNPGDSTIRLKDMDVHRANRVLTQSIKYDTTYVTTVMLMEMYLEDFLEDRQIPLKEIVDEFDTVMDWLAKINECKSILNSEEVIEMKNEFKESLKMTLIHYDIEESVYQSIAKIGTGLAEIRYSAFNAINELEIAQFSHGEPSKQKPRIYKNIFLFRDINTLLRWMMTVESGVVLAMIQDEAHLDSSYFVFAIRNGGNLSIVTDRERTAHPLQTTLSRSRARGREFYDRIMSYHFPYSILDVDYGDNHRAYLASSGREILLKEDGVAIKEIKDLEYDEIVWLIMMVSLLEQKFFQENYQTKELSYTAKMMVEKDFLIEEAKKKEVLITSYPTLEVPALTTQSLQTKKLKNVFAFEPTGQHDWMVERYSVPEEVFQVVGDKEPRLLLSDKTTFSDSIAIPLRRMDVSTFGSVEKLERDRIYLARYNQAKVIHQKAKNEFEERKNEVIEWYREAINKNLPNLLLAIAKGEFLATKDPEMARTRDGGWEQTRTNGNMLRVGLLKEENFCGFTHCHIKGVNSEMSKITCALNDTTASLVGHFYPRTANQLADLCGCDTNELHELLQHWKMEKQTTGNCILDSVDPMDWAIQDPWEKLRLDVRIYLSKKAYNQLCKKYRTDKESFWLNKAE